MKPWTIRLVRSGIKILTLVLIMASVSLLYFYQSSEQTPVPAAASDALANPLIYSFSGKTMGTDFNVQLSASDNVAELPELGKQINRLLSRLDTEVFSTWVDDSELMRFNQVEPGSPFTASEELLAVLKLSKKIYTLSSGAFDITVAPLVNLWGFGPASEPTRSMPDATEIATALAQTGLGSLTISDQTLVKTQAIQLDVSGIAKGYAVDQLANLLISEGYQSWLVEIGGELRLQGQRPDGSSWVVAIEKPQPGMREVFARITSNGQPIAIAGSGDYRNYRELDGVRYSHEIDPTTGYPINHTLASVTVLDNSAARADALATAFMVIGYDEGYALATGLDLPVYFIIRTNTGFEEHHTSAFSRYLH